MAYFFISMVLTALAVLLVVSLAWFLERDTRFKDETQELSARLLAEKEAELRHEVDEAVSFVEHASTQSRARLRRRLRDEVHTAIAMLTTIYSKTKDRVPRAEMEALLRESLRPIRHFGGRGYFFITRADGVEILFADRPELEGRNLLEMRDTRGKPVIRDMIELTRDGGEGFVDYTWTKPGSDSPHHPKVAFIQRFEPLDWIVGIGDYLDDVDSELQNETLSWLTQITFDKGGYLFGSTFEGDQLFTNGRVTMGGANILDVEDPSGVKIIQKQIAAAKLPEGGFVRYAWPRQPGGTPRAKLSYVRGIPEWSWVIGSGIYLDDIEAAIDSAREEMRYEMRRDMVQDGLIFLVVFASLAIATALISRRVKRELDTFAAAVGEAAREESAIDLTRLGFPETRDMAASVNELTRHRTEAQAALRRSESLLRAMVANLPFDFWARDSQQRIILQSGVSKEYWGDQTGNMPEGQGVPEETLARWRANNDRVLAGETLREEYPMTLQDGRVLDVLGILAPIRDGKDVLGFLGINIDLTPLKQAERALRASEETFRTLSEQSPVSIMSFDAEGRVTFVNDWHLKVFCLGRVGLDFFIGKPLGELPGLSSVPGLAERLLAVLTGKTIFLEDVFIPRFTGGHSGWVTIRGVPIMRGDTVAGGILIREDISERKRMVEALRESERRLSQVIQSLPDPTVAVDGEGRVTAWNRAMEALTGTPADEVVGRGDREYSRVFWGERRPMLIDQVLGDGAELPDAYDVLSTDDDSLTATMRRETDEGDRWYFIRAAAIRDAEERITGAIEMVRDITATKAAEEEIKASLQEKEVLLREIHHRVKNNLQIISSLLRLQAGELGEAHLPPILESLARIRSMSLVHEKLYLSNNLSGIDMLDYVKSQLSALFGIYGTASRGVRDKVEGGGLLLPVDQAIPCGLVINELVTNSLKHAFKGRSTGEIKVFLGQEDGKAVLMVRDDGMGLPEGFDLPATQSVGLQIVQNLALQLRGELTVLDGHGCGFALRFPMPG